MSSFRRCVQFNDHRQAPRMLSTKESTKGSVHSTHSPVSLCKKKSKKFILDLLEKSYTVLIEPMTAYQPLVFALRSQGSSQVSWKSQPRMLLHRSGRVAQAVECLSCKSKVLSSNSGTHTKRCFFLALRYGATPVIWWSQSYENWDSKTTQGGTLDANW
jgi:hypothetical protein